MHQMPASHDCGVNSCATRRGRALITTAARMRGIRAGSPAYDKLNELLDERPSEEFFEKTLRAVKAMFNFCRFPTPLAQKHPRLTSREAIAR